MMEALTRDLWASQDRHVGDRLRLFTAVGNAVEAETVLYPGSFVDIAPSMVFDDVTYVDKDRRFPKFFADEAGVSEIIDRDRLESTGYKVRSIHADYQDPLELADESFDLLISLYAGFVSEHCTHYLRVGGSLLVNPSHGDAAMASIDDRYELSGVITTRNSQYKFAATDLDSYFVPKRGEQPTVDRLHELGRGIAYTMSAFAYLFTRTS